MKQLSNIEKKTIGNDAAISNPLWLGLVLTSFSLIFEFCMENIREVEYIMFQTNQRKLYPIFGEAYHNQFWLNVGNWSVFIVVFAFFYVIWFALKKYIRWGYPIAICFGAIILWLDFSVYELVIRRVKYDLSFLDDEWWRAFYETIKLDAVVSFGIS